MVESDFMKIYEKLSTLNEKWHNSIEYFGHVGKIWFSDSAVQFKNFMANLSSSGMAGIRIAVAPNFYLAANAADFNHDMMMDVAKEKLYLDIPKTCELATCGIPKCTNFELGNFEIVELKQKAEESPNNEIYAKYLNYNPEKEYQGMLIADYGTFEVVLYGFISKTCPSYTPKANITKYFEDSEIYKALKPLLKRIYIYGK